MRLSKSCAHHQFAQRRTWTCLTACCFTCDCKALEMVDEIKVANHPSIMQQNDVRVKNCRDEKYLDATP